MIVFAGATLFVHLLWIIWVIFGAFFTRGRPRLTWFHIGSLIYGVVIDAGPWECPLTALEQYLESRAGITPYRGGFIVHYLDALVYPDVPQTSIAAAAVLVLLVNGFVYWRRLKSSIVR